MEAIKHDGTFDLATGKSRKEIHWRNQEWQWSDFLKKISTTHHTAETYAEYMKSKKTRQDEIKDIGGFVGGYLTGGRRKSGNIVHRQLVTLDIDFPSDADIWDLFGIQYSNAAAIYSTHKHRPDAPRLRLIIPLARPVSTDEYVAIARRIAGHLDINAFDDTTYEPSRLMYWPSTAKDAEYIFRQQDGPWLDPDEVLSSYCNWKDASEWPASDRAGEVIHREIKKAGDPTEKTGLIGTFCREYNIHEAIEKFLSDIYEPTTDDDRYTYRRGSTAAGLVVYAKGLYAYSHHGTDPAAGKLCNSFDLVRIHLYSIQDEDAKPGASSTSLPSFKSMMDEAGKDPQVRKRIGMERMEQAKEDFEIELTDEGSTDWLSKLHADRKGNYESSIDNVLIILENDGNLKGKLCFNEFENRAVTRGPLPWRKIVSGNKKFLTDNDEAGLRHYLEKIYNISSLQKVRDAFDLILQKNTFHPVREYLDSLPAWDGTARLDTLLIDYLGADDNEYTRAITRKAFTAAVARIYRPGCKFDYILTLSGPQGCGKSSLVRLMGLDWFSDSFTTVQGKEAFEQIQGVWIMEMAELAGMRKAEAEQIKHFISKGEDRFRQAYGRRTETFPRQCVFIATTNSDDFLRDATGNRRFWPVRVKGSEKDIHTELAEITGQLWAEAKHYFSKGETLYLDASIEAIAQEQQRLFMETDERQGIIEQYLNTPLPEDWEQMDIFERKRFLSNDELNPLEGTTIRDKVSIAEIWVELFNRPLSEMTNIQTRPINAIMRKLGWMPGEYPARVNNYYGKQRLFIRPSEQEDNLLEQARKIIRKTPF